MRERGEKYMNRMANVRTRAKRPKPEIQTKSLGIERSREAYVVSFSSRKKMPRTVMIAQEMTRIVELESVTPKEAQGN